MLGVGLRAELACRKKRLRGTGRADLVLLVLLMANALGRESPLVGQLRRSLGERPVKFVFLTIKNPGRRRPVQIERRIADRPEADLSCRIKPSRVVATAGAELLWLSGRFAMIDDRRCFQLVSSRPALEQHLGRHVSGVMMPGGGVEWSFGRKRKLAHWSLRNISIPSLTCAAVRCSAHRY